MQDFMKRIEVNPKVMVGKPAIKGARIAVYEVVARAAQGQAFKEIAEDLDIAEADIKAALMYAKKLLEGEGIFPVIKGSHKVSH